MSATIISRAAWGARRPRNAPSSVPSMSGLAGHWNGDLPVNIGSHDDCAAAVRGVQRFHMDGNGWNDVAYNFLICPHGFVFEGRGFRVYNAANGTTSGNRSTHTAMFLIGRGQPFTAAMRQAFVDLHSMVGGPKLYHSYFTNTQCPGDEIRGWIKDGCPIVDVVPEPDPDQPGVPPFEGGPYGRDCVRFTCEGAGVAVIQRRLQQLGHVLEDDGDFGPMTEREVIRHQRAEGITADGIVGSVTWLHMWT